MNILAIDTSTTRGSVALLAGGELRLDETFTSDRSHSATLFPILERARAAVERIDRIAIGLGPGSYAGVRIAIGAAIGLQLGLGAELVGLVSVAALAEDGTSYLAIGDARRETFYFTRVENGACAEGPRLVTEAELRDELARRPGERVLASAELPAFPGARIAHPSAVVIARLAAAGRGIVATGDLEPIYLREPHITQPKSRVTPR